jgi:hypothetical protein
MLNCYLKKPLYLNNGLRDYCNKTTNESIRKLTEKYNLERNIQKNAILLDCDDNDERPNINLLNFLLFLSVSSITFYFYKRLQ